MARDLKQDVLKQFKTVFYCFKTFFICFKTLIDTIIIIKSRNYILINKQPFLKMTKKNNKMLKFLLQIITNMYYVNVLKHVFCHP